MKMKYDKNERLAIGRRIYERELTTSAAAEEYAISFYTARDYLRAYKASIHVSVPQRKAYHKKPADVSLQQYEDMSKSELLEELIKSKINEARAKKGYLVEGVGAQKKFIPISTKSSK